MEKMNLENMTSVDASRWGVAVGLLTLPVAFVVDHFYPGRGTPAGVSLVFLIGSVWIFWSLRRKPWFWMTIAAIAIAHVALIIVIPWSHWIHKSFPAPELWPIGIADFAAMIGFIKLVEKVMTRGVKD